MQIPSKQSIEQIRKNYPVGCRIELLEMNDKQAPPIGTRGTVRGVDDIGSNFFTYPTWDALVESEKEQTDGLTEEELRAEFEKEPGSIWRLPCGWYVQYV